MSRPVTFHFWTSPDASHPLWAEPYFLPMPASKVDLSSPATPEGSAQDVVDALAACVANRAAHGLTMEGWAAILKNWGYNHFPPGSDPSTDRPNTFSLAMNYRDRLQGMFGGSPSTPTEKLIASSCYYSDGGMALLRDWTMRYGGSKRAKLIAAGLPLPGRGVIDWEEQVNFDQYELPSPPNAWTFHAGDARYDTALIDGNRTLRQIVDAARTIDGGPVTLDAAQNFYADANRGFNMFAIGLNALHADYLAHKAFTEPFVGSFPGARCSNFLYLAGTRARPAPGERAWHRIFMDAPLRAGTISPVLYPFTSNAFTGNLTGLSDQEARYGLPGTGSTTDRYWAVVAAFWHETIRVAQLAWPGVEVVPWVASPGYSLGIASLGITATLTVDLLSQLLATSYSMGTRDYLMWQHADTPQVWDDTLTVIRRASAYADSEHRTKTARFSRGGKRAVP